MRILTLKVRATKTLKTKKAVDEAALEAVVPVVLDRKADQGHVRDQDQGLHVKIGDRVRVLHVKVVLQDVAAVEADLQDVIEDQEADLIRQDAEGTAIAEIGLLKIKETAKMVTDFILRIWIVKPLKGIWKSYSENMVL